MHKETDNFGVTSVFCLNSHCHILLPHKPESYQKFKTALRIYLHSSVKRSVGRRSLTKSPKCSFGTHRKLMSFIRVSLERTVPTAWTRRTTLSLIETNRRVPYAVRQSVKSACRQQTMTSTFKVHVRPSHITSVEQLYVSICLRHQSGGRAASRRLYLAPR